VSILLIKTFIICKNEDLLLESVLIAIVDVAGSSQDEEARHDEKASRNLNLHFLICRS
jgi:hypothetical protein